MNENQVPHEAALVHDALQVYVKALRIFTATGVKKNFAKQKHDCSDPRQPKSQFGFELAHFMKTQEHIGITWNVEFNTVEPYKGSRTQFELEILEYSKGEFNRIGTWDTTKKVKYDRQGKDPEAQIEESLIGKNLKIVVKLGDPFFKIRTIDENAAPLEGNARYEGYVVDLINKMQQNLKFKYELEVVPDGNYGNYDPDTKKWNGLVRHLLDRKADLAVADMSITYERKTAVDFTMPFMR
jgi:glutamate receptor, ionotropic, invertebrate